MSVYKDTKNNTWKVYYRFTDWQGKVHQSTKRGFPTKREALAWEREQLHKVEADLDMTFESFIDTYTADMKNRLKENTWHTKEHIIRTKLLPYFAKRKMNSIQPKDIIAWQNEMIKCRDKSGEAYSPVYLKTLHNQLSAIFNHAVKFYGLKDNPAAKVGNMGKAKAREMLFWTQEEYKKFSEEMMDKPVSFYAFEMLYIVVVGDLNTVNQPIYQLRRQIVIAFQHVRIFLNRTMTGKLFIQRSRFIVQSRNICGQCHNALFIIFLFLLSSLTIRRYS